MAIYSAFSWVRIGRTHATGELMYATGVSGPAKYTGWTMFRKKDGTTLWLLPVATPTGGKFKNVSGQVYQDEAGNLHFTASGSAPPA